MRPKNCAWLGWRGAYFRASEVRYFPLDLSEAGVWRSRRRKCSRQATKWPVCTREAAPAHEPRLPPASGSAARSRCVRERLLLVPVPIPRLTEVPALAGGGVGHFRLSHNSNEAAFVKNADTNSRSKTSGYFSQDSLGPRQGRTLLTRNM